MPEKKVVPSLTSRRLEFGLIVRLSFGERWLRAGFSFKWLTAGWFFVGVRGCMDGRDSISLGVHAKSF